MMAMAEQAKELQSPAVAELRRVYSDVVVDHALHPRNAGELPDADGMASITTQGGDTVRLWLRMRDGRVVQSTFWTDSCVAMVASLSMVTELVRGKGIAEALKLTQRDVLDALGGLPEGNVHCARQAVDALRAALRDYLDVTKEPWKRAYRRR